MSSWIETTGRRQFKINLDQVCYVERLASGSVKLRFSTGSREGSTAESLTIDGEDAEMVWNTIGTNRPRG